MRDDLAIQEAWTRRIPVVFHALGGHDRSETLQESNIILVNFVGSLALLLHLFQLGGDVGIVVGWIEIDCWSDVLHFLAMLMKAF